MKTQFFFAALLCATVAAAQPYPVPALAVPQNMLGNGANLILHASDVISPADTTNPVTTPATAHTDFVSNHRVLLHSGFHALAADSGYFHAQIGAVSSNTLNVAVIEPAPASPLSIDVQQFEKLELGLQLPQSIITAFHAYRRHSGGLEINPFNPDEMDVQATYYHYSSPTTSGIDEIDKGFGFYYEDYHRDLSAADPNQWHGVQDTTSYLFRIRFSPPKVGRWLIHIAVTAPAANYSASLDLTINCVTPGDPANKGFVHTRPSYRYLELGDDTWMPIGQNLPWPGNFIPYDNFVHQLVPSDRYLTYYEKLAQLSRSGANYVRTILFPNSTDIEYDTLNNYFQRMYCAWETDHLLDTAKKLGLYVHFDLQIQTPFETRSSFGQFLWDWSANSCVNYPFVDSGFCYPRELGLASPVDFLTDSTAKANYKKRLRYIFARWGFARQVAVYELASEINNWGFDGVPDTNCRMVMTRPYEADPTVPPKMAAFQNEMLHYIKSDLGVHRLLAVSNAGPLSSSDNSFSSPDLDVCTFNNYGAFASKVKSYYDDAKDQFTVTGKPFFHSEIGGGDDGDSGLCVQTEWIKSTWAAPFSGLAGGMNWAMQTDTTYWYMFGIIRALMAGEDFNDDLWEPVYQLRNDDEAEAVYLVSPTADRAMGIVLNRNFNGRARRSCNICDCINIVANGPPPVNQAEDVEDNIFAISPLALTVLHLDALRNYHVVWYNAMDGQILDDQHIFAGGELPLNFPKLEMINNLKPIMFFKVVPSSARMGNPQSSDTTAENKPVQYNGDEIISLSPVPATDKINVSIARPSPGEIHFRVYNADGLLVQQGTESRLQFSISTGQLAPGFYSVSFQVGDQLYWKKAIIVNR